MKIRIHRLLSSGGASAFGGTAQEDVESQLRLKSTQGGKTMRAKVIEVLRIKKTIPSLALLLALVPAGMAQDVTFSKTRYSSPKQRAEVFVNLSITDSKILIKSKKVSKKIPTIDMEIPFSSIDAMSYELASRHRVQEGTAVMAVSLGAGAIVMGTKTKSHWLAIDYHEGAAKQSTVLQLDKSEYENVIATLEARTGKHITVLDSKTSSLNPTKMSKDMDEVIPFGMDKVVAALKPAMESVGCKVKKATDTRIECKRDRGYSEQTGGGGEKVTATLEAQGAQTHIRIWTGKGFTGKVGKDNWSTPVYQELMKILQEPPKASFLKPSSKVPDA